MGGVKANDARPLRIAVIAHGLRAGGGLSAGRSLVASILSVAPQNTYLLIVPDLGEYRSISIDPARHETIFYRRRGGHVGRHWFDLFQLPSIVRRFQPDAVLALGNRGMQRPPCVQAILCRDAHLFYPFRHFGKELLRVKAMVAYHRWLLKRELRHTQLLLCQTEVARKRLVQTFDYQGETTVCGNAVSPETLQVVACDLPRPLAGVRDKTRLFCLARYYPQKNIETVVEMFERFGGELDDVVVVITIAPDQHPCAGKLLTRIRRAGLDRRIINVGPLSQEEIAAYYRHCHALLLPTLLESFTRTYLEAMHFGVPILTSDLDFAHEVCGDAAAYFDPWKPEAIKSTITRLRNEPQWAQDLVSKGRSRLQSHFHSWDRIAATILNGLSAVVAKNAS